MKEKKIEIKNIKVDNTPEKIKMSDDVWFILKPQGGLDQVISGLETTLSPEELESSEAVPKALEHSLRILERSLVEGQIGDKTYQKGQGEEKLREFLDNLTGIAIGNLITEALRINNLLVEQQEILERLDTVQKKK